MNPLPSMSPIDWARRVNRSWIVHSNLNEHAEAWLDHLDDARRLESCQAARDMCSLRDPGDDPKPWFYAGLFHFATVPEAHQFLETHRVTKAAIPSMVDDESVRLWLDRVGPETRDLVGCLRAALRDGSRSSLSHDRK